MKPGRLHTPLLICLVLLQSCPAGVAKPVMIAHYICRELDLPEDFLAYVRSTGYTYVLGHARISSSSAESDWKTDSAGKRTGVYDWSSPDSGRLYGVLKREFAKADRHGLRLIPCFNIGSRWAWHWRITNDHIDYNRGKGGKRSKWQVPPFAPEPDGIDRSFRSYLDVLHAAFQSLSLSYDTLEFIHLGHDEPIDRQGHLLVASSSSVDQEWIARNGSDQQAYIKLLADEILRRVDDVSQRFASARCIIWADAWDPEHNGGKTWKAWTENGTIDVKTYTVTESPELERVRDRLVLMPWQYRRGRKMRPYDAQRTIAYFAEHGFRVIPGLAYVEWAPLGMGSGRLMMKEWVRVASLPEFSQTVIGYCVHNWWDDGKYWRDDPRPRRFLALPELVKALRHDQSDEHKIE